MSNASNATPAPCLSYARGCTTAVRPVPAAAVAAARHLCPSLQHSVLYVLHLLASHKRMLVVGEQGLGKVESPQTKWDHLCARTDCCVSRQRECNFHHAIEHESVFSEQWKTFASPVLTC